MLPAIVAGLWCTAAFLFVNQSLKEVDHIEAVQKRRAEALRKETQNLVRAYVRIKQVDDRLKKGFLLKIQDDVLYLLPARPRRFEGLLLNPDRIDEFAAEEIPMKKVESVTAWVKPSRLRHYTVKQNS